jgi:hypothetical protein
MRAGAAGMRQARVFVRPAAVATLPRCRPRFREGRAAPVPLSFARLRDGWSFGMARALIPGGTACASIHHPGEAAEKRRLRRAASEARGAREARVVATRLPTEA